MNLSSLVHGGRQHQHQFSERYSQYPASREQIMASSLVANPYTTQPVGQVVNYAYVSAPQAPPSPPIDETSKCSLPSISSLLGLADGGSPESSPKQQPQSQSSPPPHHQQPHQQQQQPQTIPQQHVMVDYRQNQTSQYDVPTPVSMPRGALPPTPPMHMDSGFDGRQSPSAASSSQYSVSSAPGYYFHQPQSAINNVEPQNQRQHVPVPVQRRATMPQQAPLPYQQAPYAASQYTMSPSQQSMSSYYGSPMQQTPPQQQISGLYYQRPLPQQFPPPIMPVSVSLAPANGANPWQHHHYISPSSQASFPQSQDRYICQTCQKAFSRPSSLRIHSHSHTGEKPFKCPHQGCGKAFSVRSNMKRHERGCHTFESHVSMQ